MRVLISGCCGMFGSHLSEAFCEDGHTVIGIDDLSIGYKDNIINHPNFTFIKTDITDFQHLCDIFPKNIDVIYHTACIPYESFSPWAPAQIINSVVCGTTNLASLAIQNKVNRFINFSSAGRYGKNSIPYKEDMVLNPQDPYSIAKVSAENILKNLAEIHDLEWLNVVPHNCMSSRSVYTSPHRNVICIWINLILQKKRPYIYGDGSTVRHFSFVEDQLDLLKNFAFYNMKENGETFNIGGDKEEVSLNELYEIVAELLDFKDKPIYAKKHKQEVKVAVCSCEKIHKRFGYESKITLREGIQSIIDYIKERGPRPFEYKLELEIMNENTPTTWAKKLL